MATKKIVRDPSLRLGLRLTMSLWRLVLGIWIVHTLALLPAMAMVDTVVGSALAELPDGGAVAGDRMLIAFEALRPVAAPLLVVIVAGLFLIWQWGILWRAGVVSWQVWAGGGPPSFSGILGLGMAWWWRYLRLSLIAIALTGMLCGMVWIPLFGAAILAQERMAEGAAMFFVLMAVFCSFILWTIAWVSSLRAAWVLGRPDRRSAFLAWIRSLVDTLRSPIKSFAPFLVWTFPLALLLALPVGAAWQLPVFRGGLVGTILLHASAVAAAFCRVALLATFAPASGLITIGEEKLPAARASSSAARKARGQTPAPTENLSR